MRTLPLVAMAAILLAGCASLTPAAGCRGDGTGCNTVTLRLESATTGGHELPGEGLVWTFTMDEAPPSLPADIVSKVDGLHARDQFTIEAPVAVLPRRVEAQRVDYPDMRAEDVALPDDAVVGTEYVFGVVDPNSGQEVHLLLEVRELRTVATDNGTERVATVRVLEFPMPELAVKVRVQAEGERFYEIRHAKAGNYTAGADFRVLGSNETSIFYSSARPGVFRDEVTASMTFRVLRVEATREDAPTEGPYAFPRSQATPTTTQPAGPRLG